MSNLSFKKNIMSLSDYIGNTPIVKLNNIVDKNCAAIWAKLECMNPAGNLKERICISMIEDAERKGLIKQGKTRIVEASSGNTGMSMAVYCKIKGYDLIIVMPENVNKERVQLINVYGGKVLFSPANKGMQGALDMADYLAENNNNYFLIDQFENELNPKTHKMNTASEILNQIEGELDAFVMGIGTGGTICGVASLLKEKYPNIKVIAVEP
ncbi:MAG: PLP-dependent cysteine synthase family protein, partial [Thermodesulfobacteriota bacterium]